MNLGEGVDCSCMELVAAGWCTRKWLRLDLKQFIVLVIWGNPACGDSTGSNRLKKTSSCIPFPRLV